MNPLNDASAATAAVPREQRQELKQREPSATAPPSTVDEAPASKDRESLNVEFPVKAPPIAPVPTESENAADQDGISPPKDALQ